METLTSNSAFFWLFAIFQNSVKHAKGTVANNQQQIREVLYFATALSQRQSCVHTPYFNE